MESTVVAQATLQALHLYHLLKLPILAGSELMVRTNFNDPPLIKYMDTIGVFDRRGAVGNNHDHHGGPPLTELTDFRP